MNKAYLLSDAVYWFGYVNKLRLVYIYTVWTPITTNGGITPRAPPSSPLHPRSRGVRKGVLVVSIQCFIPKSITSLFGWMINSCCLCILFQMFFGGENYEFSGNITYTFLWAKIKCFVRYISDCSRVNKSDIPENCRRSQWTSKYNINSYFSNNFYIY